MKNRDKKFLKIFRQARNAMNSNLQFLRQTTKKNCKITRPYLYEKILDAFSMSSGQKTNRHFSSGEETEP